MIRFRTRRMGPSDEVLFNDTYNALVQDRRAPRPLEVMRRIWHEGPGGPVRSWLIEAQEDGGEWRLAGHHGLCPIRFTRGPDEFVFAKTVNTFLLPEFRGKFLYLRFELKCLAEVEHEFDATYTLTSSVIRMRGAIGYDTSIEELAFEQGLHRPHIIARLLMRATWRYPHSPAPLASRLWCARALQRRTHLSLLALDGQAAMTSAFFADFWDQARLTSGLAPRRDIADLAWRFWAMPDPRRTTLAYSWADGERAFCIVNQVADFHFTMEDIALTAPRPDLLEQFVDAVFDWCACHGGLMISFMTTPDSQPSSMLEVYQRRMGRPLNRRHRDQHMSRRLTQRGRERLNGEWPACNVTAILAMA